MLDIGLLVVRVVVGGLLAAHGLQKLTGWFGGPGIEGNSGFLASLGYRRPRALAWVHGVAETGAGVLLAAGTLVPLAVAAIVAVMLNAAMAVHARNGLWVQDGGYEYPLVLATIAIALGLTGPGRYAVDAVVGWDPSVAWTGAGIVLGLAGGVIALAMRGRSTADVATPSARRDTPAAA